MTAPRQKRPACWLAFVAVVLAAGCAHQRQAHYPPSGQASSEKSPSWFPMLGLKKNTDTAQAPTKRGPTYAESAQARAEPADDPDRFDFDQVRD